ncbi:uncharacterized protein BDW70DRAFT_137436 [Aspergillus foveolatus]|uniref:uncharacterized protein n=1 Tax=Aspergillus foveolatus TaxID=210207 RepID=UPI003CCCD2F2
MILFEEPPFEPAYVDETLHMDSTIYLSASLIPDLVVTRFVKKHGNLGGWLWSVGEWAQIVVSRIVQFRYCLLDLCQLCPEACCPSWVTCFLTGSGRGWDELTGLPDYT